MRVKEIPILLLTGYLGSGKTTLVNHILSNKRGIKFVGGGEGKLPAAPSHGLCGSAGGLPSQSPNGDSSPKGGAKYVRYQKLAQSQVSPPPLGGAGARWAPFSA